MVFFNMQTFDIHLCKCWLTSSLTLSKPHWLTAFDYFDSLYRFVTLYLGRRWVYTKQKNVTLISYRAISHTGFVCPTTWGNNPNSVRYREEGGSLPSCTPTVPPAQRWLFRETCVPRARDKAGILNVFIQFNPLPHETIELDNRPIETSISMNYACKLWNFGCCLFGFFLAPLLLSVSHQMKM